MSRWIGVLALVVAALGIAPPAANAASGYCTGAGVNAVVDFGALGGGLQKYCDPGGDGKSASAVYHDLGIPLDRVQRYPGAVCRVEHQPSSASCADMPPTDAYWGLFSSNGSGWSYSSVGVDSITMHDGDTVAFAWQSTASHTNPHTAPAARRTASPTPSPAPAPTASSAPRHHDAHPSDRTTSPAPTESSTAATASPSPSASPSTTASKRPRRLSAAAPVVARAISPHGSACTGSGVDVVVDFHQLGGGVLLGCAQGAHVAWDAFGKAGVRLTELSKFAGGICRVDGLPAKASCASMPPADAYWSLYVAQGRKWGYASKGAKQLKVANGDVVALSWQGGKKPAPPRVGPTGLPTRAAPSASATPVAAPASSSENQDPGGTPWWVPVVVIVVLGGGAGAAVWRRRMTQG
ncbi:hypothetical protein [Nocardioides terrisoli]|uniref:hypothetical protein n=1 Tax=Nocardioides terrisoli TaxID=3388267 RepID=UPI00287BC453|nr:hypothetical protein [Nocardioides marmorisolisilvae]